MESLPAQAETGSDPAIGTTETNRRRRTTRPRSTLSMESIVLPRADQRKRPRSRPTPSNPTRCRLCQYSDHGCRRPFADGHANALGPGVQADCRVPWPAHPWRSVPARQSVDHQVAVPHRTQLRRSTRRRPVHQVGEVCRRLSGSPWRNSTRSAVSTIRRMLLSMATSVTGPDVGTLTVASGTRWSTHGSHGLS